MTMHRLLLLFLAISASMVQSGINEPFPSLKDLWTSSSPKLGGEDGNEIVPESDLRNPDRRIWIITTACLPWMTGTSINPLLRAAYLAKDRAPGKITLMVPWLQAEQQELTYPNDIRFNTPEEQKAYVKKWLVENAKMPSAAEKLDIVFYAATYHDEYQSIFPMGDITALIPDEQADVCLLEEPEHLNWYRAPFTGNVSILFLPFIYLLFRYDLAKKYLY